MTRRMVIFTDLNRGRVDAQMETSGICHVKSVDVHGNVSDMFG